MSDDQRKIVIRPRTPSPPPAVPVRARKRQTFKKADIMRAMDAARSAGLDVDFVELGPDGTIRLAVRARNGAAHAYDAFAKWEAQL